jgi:hypothetical protein
LEREETNSTRSEKAVLVKERTLVGGSGGSGVKAARHQVLKLFAQIILSARYIHWNGEMLQLLTRTVELA